MNRTPYHFAEKVDTQLDEKGKELVKEIVNAVITKKSLEKIMS